MRSTALLLTGASALLSCASSISATATTAVDGGSTTPTDDGSTPTDTDVVTVPVTVDSLADGYTRAECAAILACPFPGFDTQQYGDLATCVERFLPFNRIDLEGTLASIRAGRILLDGAAMRRCLDRLSTACLLVDVDLDARCPGALTGTLAADAGCWLSLECAPGLYCEHGTRPRSCPGTCQPRRPAGALCTSSSQCERSAGHVPVCTRTCVDGTFGPDAAEGESCGRVPVQGGGVRLVACAGHDLFCTDDLVGPGTCRRVRREGERCEPVDACATGLACRASPGTTATACRRVTLVDAPGGACDAEGAVGLCNAMLNLTCVSGACRRDGDGSVDSPCRTSDLWPCQPGLYCAEATSTCQPRLAPGAACTYSADCRSNECSQDAPRRCLERVCN
ncbi:MAG: Tryptophan synthase alpha chain [Myxococcaceae bacterium]|nr:Tryptophan synthase alpha chain [Myxococcaceae bacterium]